MEFSVGTAPYLTQLGYSYSVAGTTYRGTYKRNFESEDEAAEFIRELNGKPASVHYNPGKPSASALSESSIQTLQATRMPVSVDENAVALLVDSIPAWFRPFIWPFFVLSAIGLVLSLLVHVGALLGRRVAPSPFFWLLHLGIFVVWIPVILAMKQRRGYMNSKNFWKAVLNGAPDWMRYMTYGFLAYAVLNFLFFMAQAPSTSTGDNPPAQVWRGFSGHWMAFYSASMATLYAAAHANATARRCLNGHAVPESANFCTRCGQPIVHM